MTTTLPLPPLVGTRHRAQALADTLPAALDGDVVVVDGRALMASTESFADELVRILLVERGAGLVQVRNLADPELAGWLRERAAFHGVEGHLQID